MFVRGVAHGKDTDPDRDKRGEGFAGYTGNTMDQVGSLQRTATKLPTTPFTGTVHAVREGCGGGNNVDNDENVNLKNCDLGVTINGGGDSESRPINANVEWIIRVK